MGLLEKSSALCCFGVSCLVQNTKIGIDGGGWDARSEDDDIERSFLPLEIRSNDLLSNRIDNLGPLHAELSQYQSRGANSRDSPGMIGDLRKEPQLLPKS